MPVNMFCGIYPCGLVFADKSLMEAGDYKDLAFINYRTLKITWRAKKMSHEFRRYIISEAKNLRSMRGQQYQISSCGQYIILGE